MKTAGRWGLGAIIALALLGIASAATVVPRWAPFSFYACYPLLESQLWEYGLKVLLQACALLLLLAIRRLRMVAEVRGSVETISLIIGIPVSLVLLVVALWGSSYSYETVSLGFAGDGCEMRFWGAPFVGAAWALPFLAMVVDVAVGVGRSSPRTSRMIPWAGVIALIVQIGVLAVYLCRSIGQSI